MEKNNSFFLQQIDLKEVGWLFFENSYALAEYAPLVMSTQDFERIETKKLKIYGHKVNRKYITRVNDSLILVNPTFYPYNEVKAIGVVGSRGSIQFKRFNVFFSALKSMRDPVLGLKQHMRESDLNDSQGGGGLSFGFGPEINAVYDLEMRFYLNKSHGLLLNYERASYMADGFKRAGGYKLTLDLKCDYYSLAYNYSLVNQRANFIVGPSLLSMLKIEDARGGSNDFRNEIRQNKLGIILGASFNLVHKRFWFLSVKTQYRWYPKESFGPYTLTRNGQVSSTFSQIDVNLNSFEIGLGLGLRL